MHAKLHTAHTPRLHVHSLADVIVGAVNASSLLGYFNQFHGGYPPELNNFANCGMTGGIPQVLDRRVCEGSGSTRSSLSPRPHPCVLVCVCSVHACRCILLRACKA